MHGTKKGSIPLPIESQAKGQKVNILRNVDGDMEALLTDPKESLGTGCLAHENGSIQGEQEDQAAAFLTKKGCLVGVKGCPGRPWSRLQNRRRRQCHRAQ